jgi:hypothetical protein
MTHDRDHVRPDGGIDTLDPPPIDVLTEDTLEPETLAENTPGSKQSWNCSTA